MFFKIDDHILLRFHKKYDISFIEVLNKKLDPQYVKSFKMIERIDNLIYRLSIFIY